jgi:hypothetical protein
MKCQICGNEKLEKFLDLGQHPACDFLLEDQLKSEKRYPLDAHFCGTCGLMQLGHPLPPDVLFGENYHHIAALSASFLEHMKQLAEASAKRFGITDADLVVELGSNDGALLEAYKKFTPEVVGVDPSDIAEMAIKKGIPTLRKFFDEKVAGDMVAEYGQAKIIASLNTFAHISKLDSFVTGVRELLTDDGVFITESHYLLDLVNELQYDFIYHEHSRYYSLRSLVYLFEKLGMEVFDVERLRTHSGSIRVFAGKKGAHPVSGNVKALLAEEDKAGLHKAETYVAFGKKVEAHKAAFTKMLAELKAAGHSIAGLTFPARAVTLLNYCGIGPETLSYITEGSPIKIGRYSPGTHIKCVDQNVLFGADAPEYGVLLSWHIEKEIVPKFRAKGFKGKFIIPLPEPRVID